MIQNRRTVLMIAISRPSVHAGEKTARIKLGMEAPMFSFYIKRSFVDTLPGIDLVNIHYTWTPLGQAPNWEAHRETRAMPRGGTLVRGMGGTTIDEQGQVLQTSSETIEIPDDGIRRKIIKLPVEIED